MCDCGTCGELAPVIAELLARLGAPTLAREIANRLAVDKSAANHCLYANPERFEQGAGYTWSSAPQTSAAFALHRWQEEALDCWDSAGEMGIVQAVTGAGKARVGLEAATEFLRQPGARVVVLVPTTVLLDQWRVKLEESLGLTPGVCGGSRNDNMLNHRATVYLVHRAIDYSRGGGQTSSRSGIEAE